MVLVFSELLIIAIFITRLLTIMYPMKITRVITKTIAQRIFSKC